MICALFSRESDSTTTNVCSFVHQSVNKTPQQLKIIHFALPQHSPPLTPSHITSYTPSHTTSPHNIITQHHHTKSPHNITMQHHHTTSHTPSQPSSSPPSISSFTWATFKLFSLFFNKRIIIRKKMYIVIKWKDTKWWMRFFSVKILRLLLGEDIWWVMDSWGCSDIFSLCELTINLMSKVKWIQGCKKEPYYVLLLFLMG